jgi:hypothetical protein
MRKAGLLRVLTVTAVVVLATGCANVTGTSTDTDEIAAKDLAMSVADPTTGTTQEMTDIGSCVFGVWGAGPRPWSLFRASNFALYLWNGNFTWNSTNNDYQLNEKSSAATISIAIAFFTSRDASGTGVEVAPLTTGATPFSSIHSMTYNRQIQGNFTNSFSHIQRQLNSTSTFTVTDLTMNGSSPGFTVNGTRTDNFTNKYTNGATVTGSLTENINNVVVTAALQSGGSYLVTATGTIQVDYSATITRANGTTVTVSHTATITLNGQETVYVNMDGALCKVDMTTGETE